MTRKLTYLAGAILFLVLAPTGWAQMMTVDQVEAMVKSAQPAAEAGLDVIRNLQLEKGGENGAPALSDADMETLALGIPLKHTFIRLDQLRAYQEGDDPAGLLVPQQQLTFPVQGASGVVSAITVATINNEWQLASVGDGDTMRTTVEKRRQSSGVTGVPEDQHFLVKVSALNLHYVGVMTGAGLQLTLISSKPSIPQPQPADQVFRALAATAREVEDLPH